MHIGSGTEEGSYGRRHYGIYLEEEMFAHMRRRDQISTQVTDTHTAGTICVEGNVLQDSETARVKYYQAMFTDFGCARFSP